MLERTALLISRGLAISKGVSLLMIDIDRFKGINDTHGHAAGDRVLKEVAARMAGSCRAGDLLGRVGGEEFLAVFADVTAADAAVIAERLREAVARTPVETEGGGALAVTVSGGILWLAPEAEPAPVLTDALSLADAALYRAKAEGRNRIVTAI